MEKQYVNVYIEWFKKDVKLEKIPSKGIRFCPQIRFEDEGDILPSWTTEVIIRKWDINSSCYAELKYLTDEAPHYLLERGKKFVLFDGPNAIAMGEIINDFS